jgi:tetratricopeptide (TPR) repeat protein
MLKVIIAILLVMCFITASAEEITTPFTPEELITTARTILQSGKNVADAIESLNSILMMAPGQYTQEAHKMICEVYEKMGQPEKAKAEYRAFIAIYPDSPYLKQVRERLIAMEISAPDYVANGIIEKKPRTGQEHTINTSISEYYYTGSTSPEIDQLRVDQSVLITNIRISGIFRDDQHVTRIAIRESGMSNLITPSANKEVLSLGYVDYEDTFLGYNLRIGRQTQATGELGRFDGFAAKYFFENGVKVKATLGIPYIGPTPTQRHFYSLGIESPSDGDWTYSAYYNYQLADNFPERAAVGFDARYFKNGWSLTSVIEYDLLYKELNSVMVQGTIALTSSYNIYLLADRRKSPVLFADKVLQYGMNTPAHQPFMSVADVINSATISNADIYTFVKSATPYATTYVAGLSKQVTADWNAGIDMQVSNATASTDIGFIPTLEAPVSTIAQPAINDMYTINMRLYGTNIFRKDDTVNIILSTSADDKTSSKSFTILDSNPLENNVRVDTVLSVFDRKQQYSDSTTVITSLRLNYKVSNSSTVETQVSVAGTNTRDRLQNTTTNVYNHTLFIGWRVDF